MPGGKLLDETMKYYEDFTTTGQSFEERVGAPDEFDAAIGKIALGFSYLEDTARNVVIMLMGTDRTVGLIMTVELSFRVKLNLLASLVQHRLPNLISPEDSSEVEERYKELLVLCWRAEEFRNTYLHSSYAGRERAKISAKSKHGLRVHVEPVDSSLLLDVADLLCMQGWNLKVCHCFWV